MISTLLFSYLAAGSVLWLYDALLTLDLEVEYVWASMDPRTRSVGPVRIGFNLIYLLQRYLPFIDRVLLDLYCESGSLEWVKSQQLAIKLTFYSDAWNQEC